MLLRCTRDEYLSLIYLEISFSSLKTPRYLGENEVAATPDFSILAGNMSYLHSLWCIGMVFFICCSSLELITDNIIINAKEALKTSETLPFGGQSPELIPQNY